MRRGLGVSLFLVITIGLIGWVLWTQFLGPQCRLPDEPPADPVALLTEAADNIRAADSFRLEVTHAGATYNITIFLGEDTTASVSFRRAIAQYVADDELSAQVSILSSAGVLNLDIYANGNDQWFRFEGSSHWVNMDFAPGFNPTTLIAEDTGFQAALASLRNLEYIGVETLENGEEVYHLSGTALGPDVTSLLVGLIVAEEDVDVDVYINCDHYPARLIISQPEIDPDNPTQWIVDVYAVNAEPELIKPDDS